MIRQYFCNKVICSLWTIFFIQWKVNFFFEFAAFDISFSNIFIKEEDSSQDSDAEFEQMLAEAEDMNKAEDEIESTKKKAKTKFGQKNKKKRRKRDEDGYDTDHQVSGVNPGVVYLKVWWRQVLFPFFRISVRSVNKEVKSFCVTHAQRHTIWYA